MKVLPSLMVLCLTLSLAHGFCKFYPFEAETKDGKLVEPDQCTDPYDNSLHPFGSSWDTKECMRCECQGDGMSCCSRYGPVHVPGCTAVLDPETCKHKFYKEDDPTTLCSFQL